ncbi:MAG: alpha/beta hydrolase [Methylobacter sp.]
MRTRILLTAILFLSGCSSDPARHLEPAEQALETDDLTTLQFHSTLYYPTELSLRFDGYILGIEKSPRKTILKSSDLNIQPIPDAGLDNESANDKLSDPKLLFISHILETNSDKSGLENCTLYNAYNQKNLSKIKQLANSCGPKPPSPATPENAYRDSWKALSSLQEAIKHRVQSGKYTDIIVITMGWNTVQEEAIRNFNSITSSIKATNPNPNKFNPLVIGVTWPSEWSNEWMAPIYKLFSFPVKAGDADELGLTWLGALLHQTLPASKGNLPVTVIGHSFGSRASSVAACVGPIIYDEKPSQNKAQIDNLINLQGAFLVSRLFGELDKGIHYPGGCRNVKNIVFTASVKDTAVSSAFWGVYAGDDKSYKSHCDNDQQKIKCAKAYPDGSVNYSKSPTDSNVTYIDASQLINENAYLSGGGAHSDIYRREHGNLINKVIARTSK